MLVNIWMIRDCTILCGCRYARASRDIEDNAEKQKAKPKGNVCISKVWWTCSMNILYILEYKKK